VEPRQFPFLQTKMISPIKVWRRQKEIRKLLGQRGKVLTWTQIYVAGPNFKQYAPYPVVLVKLDDGQKVFGQLVDYENKDLKINAKVVSVLRKVRETDHDDVIAYGIKFKPL